MSPGNYSLINPFKDTYWPIYDPIDVLRPSHTPPINPIPPTCSHFNYILLAKSQQSFSLVVVVMCHCDWTGLVGVIIIRTFASTKLMLVSGNGGVPQAV